MSVLLNSFGDCQLTIKGTGIPSCSLQSIGDYLGFSLLQKSTSFAITNGDIAISETIVEDLIKSRKLHQFINKIGSTQDVAENEVFTDSIGFETSIREGKMKISTMFGGSLHRLSAIHTFKGQNRWDMMLHFSKGVLLTSNVSGTEAKGFSIGRFDVTSVKFLQGTDAQQVSTIAQFTKPDELNSRFVFIPWDKLGCDLSEKQGVIDTIVKVVTPPSAAGTTMSVKVTLAENADSVVLGLANTTAWATGGVQTTTKASPNAVVYNATTMNYDLTFATPFVTGDTFAPRLITGANDVYEDGYGMFYAGKSTTGTV